MCAHLGTRGAPPPKGPYASSGREPGAGAVSAAEGARFFARGEEGAGGVTARTEVFFSFARREEGAGAARAFEGVFFGRGEEGAGGAVATEGCGSLARGRTDDSGIGSASRSVVVDRSASRCAGMKRDVVASPSFIARASRSLRGPGRASGTSGEHARTRSYRRTAPERNNQVRGRSAPLDARRP